MTANEMWNAYLESTRASALDGAGVQNDGLQQEPSYEAWAFCGGGEAGDRLASLVLAGVKTATSSAYRLYVLEDEEIPKAGECSVILYDDGQAACVLRTTKVSVVPFKDVDERHAWLEGEGDRTLAYWRNVHLEFFGQEFSSAGLSFDEDELVVLEEFEVVYK